MHVLCYTAYLAIHLSSCSIFKLVNKPVYTSSLWKPSCFLISLKRLDDILDSITDNNTMKFQNL